eukprot:1144237-Pelagomonas_calceolata.AAC.1
MDLLAWADRKKCKVTFIALLHQRSCDQESGASLTQFRGMSPEAKPFRTFLYKEALPQKRSTIQNDSRVCDGANTSKCMVVVWQGEQHECCTYQNALELATSFPALLAAGLLLLLLLCSKRASVLLQEQLVSGDRLSMRTLTVFVKVALTMLAADATYLCICYSPAASFCT